MNRGRRAALKQRKGWKAMAEDSPADRAAGQLSRQRASLLDAALRHVPFDGWTRTALDAGARDLLLAPGAVLRLFPGGPQELIRAFSAAGAAPPLGPQGGHHLGTRRETGRETGWARGGTDVD